MDQAKLVMLLTTVDETERQSLLTRYTNLVDVNLAWRLKSMYDSVESNDPASAARVSTALSSLVQVTEDTLVSAIAAWTEGMVALDSGQMEAAIVRLDSSEAQF